jgi:hypothetical protein
MRIPKKEGQESHMCLKNRLELCEFWIVRGLQEHIPCRKCDRRHDCNSLSILFWLMAHTVMWTLAYSGVQQTHTPQKTSLTNHTLSHDTQSLLKRHWLQTFVFQFQWKAQSLFDSLSTTLPQVDSNLNKIWDTYRTHCGHYQVMTWGIVTPCLNLKS